MELVVGLVVVLLMALWWVASPSMRLRKMGMQIPGKNPWPLVGNAFQYHIVGTESLREIIETKKKYGPTFRIWIGPQLHVFLTHPDDVQMLLSSQTFITKANIYKVLDDWLGTGLLISTGKLWFRRRKAITPTFHFKVLDDFVPTFISCTDILINCLKKEVGKGFFSITPYISNCALDTIAESAMGTKVNAQITPKSEYASTLREMTRSLGEKANFPWVAVEPLYTLTGRKAMERDSLRILHDFPNQVLQDKKAAIDSNGVKEGADEFGMKKKTAFLEKLLNMRNTEAFTSDKDILDETVTFMFEGHDTTTSSLAFTLWLLGRHSEIQEKVYTEVASIYSENENPRIEDLQQMKYLERVLKESLRLYPSVPIIGRKLDADLILPSSKILVPAGAELFVPIAVMHRDEEYFDDPYKFDPDRFLEDMKHPYCYIPFSAGPRNCVGQKFAMLELKTVVSKVIYKYKIISEDKIVLNSEMILRTFGGPNVQLVERS